MSFSGKVDVTINKDDIKVNIPDDKQLQEMVDAYKKEAAAPAIGGSRRSRRTKSKSNKSKKTKRRRITRRRKH